MDFNEDIQLVELELFDAAFPIAPEDEARIRQRFMTLFCSAEAASRGGSASVLKGANLLGETFALKCLHPAKLSSGETGRSRASDYRIAAGEGPAPGGQPDSVQPANAGRARKELRHSFSGTLSKTPLPDYVTQGHIAAFYEECRVHMAVSSLRGFPKFYGMGLSDGNPVIVMEWVEGATLREAMRIREALGAMAGDQGSSSDREALRGRPELLELPVLADLGIAVLDVLERAGELSDCFVHRDISSRNIMLRSDRIAPEQQLVTGDFDVCLIDFGSAALSAPAGSDPTFTQNTDVWRMGTPAYAPPEMLSSDIELPASWRQSPTIDTYALSSVLYELYAGRLPYDTTSADGLSPFRLKTESPPAPLAPREPDGGALANAICAGLSPQQSDRPTVVQLKSALQNWKELPSQRVIGSLDGAKSADAAFWRPGYAQRVLTRRKFVAAGIVAAGVIAAGGIALAARLRDMESAKGPAVDPARYTMASAAYSGEPLFKVMEAGQNEWALATAAGKITCRPASSRPCAPLREGRVALYDDISQLYGYITPTGAAAGAANGASGASRANGASGKGSASGASSSSSGDYAWVILPAFSQAGDFSEGLAPAQDVESKLWGYIGEDGAWAIAPQYREASCFSNGTAAVQAAESLLWGAIGPDGAWLIQPFAAQLGARSNDGFAVAQEAPANGAAEEAAAAKRWGVVNASGGWASDVRFPALRRFSQGLAPALAVDGHWGFVNASGGWAITPRFRDARPFSEGYAAVQDAATQLWYFIAPDGAPAGGMAPRFWKLGDLCDGLAPAQASAEDDVVVFDEADPDVRVENVGMRYGYVDAVGTWQMRRLTDLVDTDISPAGI